MREWGNGGNLEIKTVLEIKTGLIGRLSAGS